MRYPDTERLFKSNTSSSGHGGSRAGAGRPHKSVAPPSMPPDVFQWFCVRTIYGGERLADTETRLAGFEVFNPSVWRAAESARRDRNGVVRPARPDRITSLFPRFYFARMNLADPSWHQIKRLPGVERIMGRVGNLGVPAPLSDSVINLLLGMCEPNHCIYPANHLHMNPIDVGTSLRLMTGSMEGHTGICEWSDGRRVRLLLSILGRNVPVTVSQGAVVPA